MHWKEREQVSDGAAWCAALYLLTSNPFLWSKAEAAIRRNLIDFTGLSHEGFIQREESYQFVGTDCSESGQRFGVPADYRKFSYSALWPGCSFKRDGG